ncbi:YihY/virulence factor BrkB family protein [Janthinobacterium sp. RB2R34]|uniref:YihY/virulence factor BrkB family protein n=1 Tax=Janthinobacterium sp. RB2R34 TaxID=3424193 RepID=UPI003F26EE34
METATPSPHANSDKDNGVAKRRAIISSRVGQGGWSSYFYALVQMARAAAEAWLSRRASSKGAALTLYVLFSLAPMLILVVALASIFFDEEAVRAALLTELGGLTGTQGGDALKAIISGAKRADEGVAASIISGVIVLVTATSAFAELKESLDELWQIPPSEGSGLWLFLKERVLSFGLLLVLALMLMMTLAVNAGLAAMQGSWADPTDPGKLLQYAFAGLSMLIVTVIFAFIYKYLPATPIAWGDVIVGAVLTAMLFMGGKVLIGLYLGHGDFGSAYGAAGSIVALITWIYYSAQIFFFGALFTHEYAMTLGSRRHKGAITPPQAKPGNAR